MNLFTKQLLMGSLVLSAMAADKADVQFDDISVTATKSERVTQKVPTNIRVIGKDEIETKQMNNLQEVLTGTPGVVAENINQGYDVNIFIRGSGIANGTYGTREISVVRDGVPLTDPFGASSLDYIDTQDIERFEITKGPGSIYSAGTTGGVIQIISKSVFDEQANRVRIGVGEHGMMSANANAGQKLNEKNAIRVNATNRHLQNSWRAYNDFQTTSASIKYGYLTDNMNPLDMELSYSKVDYWIPETLDQTGFDTFTDKGEITENMVTKGNTKEIYKRILALNVKYEHYMGDNVIKPRVFMTKEESLTHMSGAGYSPDMYFYGIDLEMNNNHSLFGEEAQLVAGVSYRGDSNQNRKTWAWNTSDGSPILAGTLENLLDARGDLASEAKSSNDLYGAYLQETFHPVQRTLVDVSVRYDSLKTNLKQTTYQETSWSTGIYSAVTPYTEDYSDNYTLMAARAGVSYEIDPTLTTYVSIGQGNQIPHATQLQHSPDLRPSTSRSSEIGLKGRSEGWSFDTAVYYNTVEDEIVDMSDETGHSYQNAGKTLKKGFEFSGDIAVTDAVKLGGSYSYNDYTYENFSLIETTGSFVPGTGYVTTSVNTSIKGNEFQYIPKQMYSIHANYNEGGFRGKIDTRTMESYYMDALNTMKYEGYKFVTTLMLSYTHAKQHQITLNVDNLFNKYYAGRAQYSRGAATYTAAAPRTAMLFYTYNF